ncbi:MAG TPA: OB-fold nucleic acid binding domain-containing protein [Ramlibacter sp.]
MLKRTLAICLLAAAPLVWAQNAVVGEVLEVQNVEGYSYLRLKTAQGDTWAAVPTAKVKKGDKVTVAEPMVMNNFESKALKRKFDKVVFGTLASDKAAASAQAAGPKAGPHTLPPKAAEAPDAKVPKASGPEARTVGEIMAAPDALKEKTVVVRAKIVKINSGIQGLNWVHLRDGSGSAANGTNDLIVTTKEVLKVGDIVTLKGVVRTDKNLGAGYVYKVLVEEGKSQK